MLLGPLKETFKIYALGRNRVCFYLGGWLETLLKSDRLLFDTLVLAGKNREGEKRLFLPFFAKA
jgi:hypothetical protein